MLTAHRTSPSPSTTPDSPEDEEFVYPGANVSRASDGEDDTDGFYYPGAEPTSARPQPPQPSPAQLESLYAAASSGDLPLLKKLFKNALDTGDVEPFALANDASSRTGLTALHAAASRGYRDIVEWRKGFHIFDNKVFSYLYTVVEDCGAMVDLEDKEGEVCITSYCLKRTEFIANRQLHTKLL